jgi:hypothetical protein
MGGGGGGVVKLENKNSELYLLHQNSWSWL